ncbi:MAG TPA: hypothetical protein VHM26_00995 [Chitinophagaceae bacterium]|jgi:hypothetical protein|nr:hypothetical protein [Chitinophagaceae bacterium]
MNTDTISTKEINSKEAVVPKEITNQQLFIKLLEIEKQLEEVTNKLMSPVINGR